MAISHAEWQSIMKAIERSKPVSDVQHATVSRVNEKNRQIWLEEFGKDPVEFASWDYTVRQFDPSTDSWEQVNIELEFPEKGDTVLVAKPYGDRRLARVVAPVDLYRSTERRARRRGQNAPHYAWQPGQVVWTAQSLDHTATGPIDPYGDGFWLYCNGAAVSRTQYKALFSKIGTTHGAGDGSTTFNIPDCRDGRNPISRGVNFATVGAIGGERTHTLVIAEIPAINFPSVAAHTHTIPSDGDHTHSIPNLNLVPWLGGGWTYPTGGTAGNWGNIGLAMNVTGAHSHGGVTGSGGGGGGGSTGGGGAHNNMSPYRVFGGMLIRVRR